MDNLRLFIRQQIGNLRIKKKDFLLLVEDEFDKIFWTRVLHHSTIKQQAQILPSVVSEANNATTGKGIILKYHQFCTEHPKKLKIAIDSDYDYLLNRANFNIQNHILKTYTYSIENYFCFTPSLKNLCLESTQSGEQNIFDFENFLKKYSKTIYPLFIISLLYEQSKIQFDETDFYSISDFCNDVFIDFKLVKIEDVNVSLVSLEKKVKSQTNTLKANFDNEDFETMKTNIEAKDVTLENCYLFIKGHFLLEKLLSPIIKKITNQFSSEVGASITGNEEKNKYFANLKNSTDLLKNNYNFYNCAIFNKVKADIVELEKLLT